MLTIDDIDKAHIVSWLDQITRETEHPMHQRWEEALAMGPPAPDPAQE